MSITEAIRATLDALATYSDPGRLQWFVTHRNGNGDPCGYAYPTCVHVCPGTATRRALPEELTPEQAASMDENGFIQGAFCNCEVA